MHTGTATLTRRAPMPREQREQHVLDVGDDIVAARFQAGDDDALSFAYQRWSSLVHTSAMRATGNTADTAKSQNTGDAEAQCLQNHQCSGNYYR